MNTWHNASFWSQVINGAAFNNENGQPIDFTLAKWFAFKGNGTVTFRKRPLSMIISKTINNTVDDVKQDPFVAAGNDLWPNTYALEDTMYYKFEINMNAPLDG